MALDTLRALYTRDLEKLKKEIASYNHEDNIWKVEHNISNSAGNLCLHLVGNLNNFIGKEIGHTNYVRNREAEFSDKNIPRTQLLQMVDDTIKVVDQALSTLEEEALKQDYPIILFKEKTSMEYMLIHLVTHLSYHLGQINYHRRLIDK